MSELKKSFTNISEVARQRLGITRDEYALCSYIAYRISDPRQRIAGWCCDTKEQIAAFVGVTRAGLYKMVSRLIVEGLIEAGGAVPFVWKVTEKWIDTENDCKQSLHTTVNKVYTDRKQSLQTTVNKVYTHNKVKKDISMNKKEEEKARQNSSSSGGAQFPLNEKNLEGRTSPALPPAPNVEVNDPAAPGATIYDHVPQPGYPSTQAAEFQRVDIATEVEALKTDAAIREAFTLSRKIPAANYYDYLEAFRIDISGRGESYANARQLRSHFLNWAGARFEIAQKKAVEAAAKSSLPRNILQL